ncbi:hypothetical protein N9B73_10035 [Verrucomicrobiales bacterium]|nr:hypothetical protein [Verrucomicrobiales bacterium]
MLNPPDEGGVLTPDGAFIPGEDPSFKGGIGLTPRRGPVPGDVPAEEGGDTVPPGDGTELPLAVPGLNESLLLDGGATFSAIGSAMGIPRFPLGFRN